MKYMYNELNIGVDFTLTKIDAKQALCAVIQSNDSFLADRWRCKQTRIGIINTYNKHLTLQGRVLI